MPRVVHRDDATAVLYVRVPGWLKNRVAILADEEGVSLNSWVANAVNRCVEEGFGLPPAPPARAATPGVREVLDAYFHGDSLIEPCGRPAPCERAEAGTYEVGGLVFCEFCRIRIL